MQLLLGGPFLGVGVWLRRLWGGNLSRLRDMNEWRGAGRKGGEPGYLDQVSTWLLLLM